MNSKNIYSGFISLVFMQMLYLFIIKNKDSKYKTKRNIYIYNNVILTFIIPFLLIVIKNRES